MVNSKRTSYFYAIFGMVLVLVVLGVAGALIIKAKRVSTDFKENLAAELQLADSVLPSSIPSVQATVKSRPYIKNIRFISKDEAAMILKEQPGATDMDLDLLSYNPLYNSFVINLYENYTDEASVERIKTELAAVPGIAMVTFQNAELKLLNKNVTNISYIILFVAGMLLVFAVSLIFNTIRLALFSSRFTIKTMQLIGATRWFVIKPFLGRSVWNGFISGFFAVLLLAGLLFYFNYRIPELALQNDLITFAGLFGALILFGIIISFFSTLTAVFRYLGIKVEDLY